MTTLRRAVFRFALAVGLALGPGLGLAVLGAEPALAHNVLLGSDPADGDRLKHGPPRITLRFNGEVQEGYGFVAVTGPEGGQWQDGKPRVSGATVTQPLRPLGSAGTYEVAWRVISADGHPVSGTFAFTVDSAGDGTPLPPSAEEAVSTGESGRGESGLGWGWLTVGLVGGAVVVASVVVVVVGGLPGRKRARRVAS